MGEITSTISDVFPAKRIAIVGDLVADQFLNGTISRVSREAPVFILRHDTTTTEPGAAANAAANVASLGGQPSLIGLVGADENGDLLLSRLAESGVDCSNIVRSEDLKTTTKVRVLAGQHYAARQQVIRIDYENPAAVSLSARQQLRDKLQAAADSIDAIIVSDYNLGAVDDEIFEVARSISQRRHIPLIVDSRYRLTAFAGATTATPNREEVEQILGKNFGAAECENLRSRLAFEALLITNGNQGITLFESGREPHSIAAVGSAEPVDVTGAGDTVIAAYALGLASGLSFAEGANIANHAGGLVVMKKRTATVSAEELADSFAPSLDSIASVTSN